MRTKEILIVDDDPGNLKAITETLMNTDLNCKSYTAINGLLAIEICKKRKPDLVIMDWEMPCMTGVEAIRKLKGDPETHEIPVIMTTGVRLSTDDLKLALDAGAVDYIRKPIDETELIARLTAALRQTEYFQEKVSAEKDRAEAIQERKDAELESKKREVVSKLLQMQQKEEMTREIEQIISQNLIYYKDDVRFGKIVSQINQKLTASTSQFSWDEFEHQFVEISRSFYANLSNKYPNLTANERRLCALLRLNLNTKEIASITNKSVRSVEIARTRLREKLSLTGQSIDLHSIMQEI